MVTNPYKIIIAPTAEKEIRRICDYTIEEFYVGRNTTEWMELVEEKINALKYTPKMYMEIEKFDELKRRYRRIVVKNYVILYTILEDSNVVYIVHIYHEKQNYIENIEL